ncbi:AAA domain-containing protein [Baffinella frigidus]|nr:AAA domain-containing protein [Cryptophyta sp. CCMP2293]
MRYERADERWERANGDKAKEAAAMPEKIETYEALRIEEKRVSKVILGQQTQVFLCTIASSSRLIGLWRNFFGESCPLEVHTVIVDECGCSTESSIALLLRLKPSNLILVGDHKQLPPCCLVEPRELQNTGHARSLLERCALVSDKVHFLREQYRMHPQICSVIAARFYKGMLITPSEVAETRASQCATPLCWVSVRAPETQREHSWSYMNPEEVSVAIRVAGNLRAKHPKATIAILTFYKRHFTYLEKAAFDANLAVEVLTVDSCQVQHKLYTM